MERLLQQFEKPIADASGVLYTVYLYGRSRPGDTWQGWLSFERVSDGRRFVTDVETTQSNAEGILYWATGLTDAYFDGALERAQHSEQPQKPVVSRHVSLVDDLADTQTRRRHLADLERAVLACLMRHRTTRLTSQAIFDEVAAANADVVRALEDLEKQGGMVIRRTEQGNDLVFLTPSGIAATGLAGLDRTEESAPRDPARSG